MPKVNVHIVTFNSGKYISKCLESVIAQTQPVQQIIVVDNSSTDNTLDLLESFSHHITLICNQSNVGFACAHNQALQHMNDSDYVLVLNPDILLNKNYIHEIVKFMDVNISFGSCTGKLLRTNGLTIDSTGILMFKNRKVVDRGMLEDASLWDKSTEVFGVSGAAAIYRRIMIADVSINGTFFDNSFFAYKEDVDIAWRARWLGWKSFFIHNAVAYHDRGWQEGKRKSIPLKIRIHSYSNRYRMMIKNESLLHYLKHVIWILPYDLLMFVYLMFREPFVLIVSWYWLLKDLKKIYNDRKLIRSRRKVKAKDLYAYFE